MRFYLPFVLISSTAAMKLRVHMHSEAEADVFYGLSNVVLSLCCCNGYGPVCAMSYTIYGDFHGGFLGYGPNDLTEECESSCGGCKSCYSGSWTCYNPGEPVEGYPDDHARVCCYKDTGNCMESPFKEIEPNDFDNGEEPDDDTEEVWESNS